MIKRGADSRSEYRAVVVPELPGGEPVFGLAGSLLAQCQPYLSRINWQTGIAHQSSDHKHAAL